MDMMDAGGMGDMMGAGGMDMLIEGKLPGTNDGMMDMGAMKDMDFGGGGDRFEPIVDNELLHVSRSPVSTFSIDVDTASYAKVRSMLQRHSLPSPDSVRIEEMLNYFHYDHPTPTDDHLFSGSMEIESYPWNPEHRLARIGIKSREIETDRHPAILSFCWMSRVRWTSPTSFRWSSTA
jgi:Ca-activated chloride channel family protein